MQMTYMLMTLLFVLFGDLCAKDYSSDNHPIQYGKASWYSVKCNNGTKTASGTKLSDSANTAAHKTLPLGTKVKVTNISNGKFEIVKISDRGPWVKNRLIDVTVGVAKKLEFFKQGVVNVKIELIE